MLIWWILSHLFIIVVSFCSTSFHSNQLSDCTNKERGKNSFLWVVNRFSPAYLFGTIHVPYDRVWEWIPENSKIAFANSDSAIFELDLTNPYTTKVLADCQMLPKGESLSDFIPQELYSRLQRHLDYVRASMHHWMSEDQNQERLFSDHVFNAITGNWRRKRPVWVMVLINSLTETSVKSRSIPVLDLYLAQQSGRNGKITGAVERAEEQCGPLNRLNLNQVIFALNQTLSHHEHLGGQGLRPPCRSEALIQQYNCGDLGSFMFGRDTTQVPVLVNFSTHELEKMQKMEQYFQHELVDKRNAKMADRVAFLLQENPDTSFFFAFGAGHFLGKENVIDRLRRTGLVVEHVGPLDHITRAGHSKRDRQSTLKMIRSPERQKQLNFLWDKLELKNLAPDRWDKMKPRNGLDSQDSFHDLWVPTEKARPHYLQKMDTSSISRGISTLQTSLQNKPSANSSTRKGKHSSVSLGAVLALLICATLNN